MPRLVEAWGDRGIKPLLRIDGLWRPEESLSYGVRQG